ncbi:unnamed protein product, partial [Discosporangium mesarthrocarpum]
MPGVVTKSEQGDASITERMPSAEERLSLEKTWLSELPESCHAEPSSSTDFLWTFRISGLHGTLYQEAGKVAFRAYFPRDYPNTPPTLLLMAETIHPNWKFPARGLEIPRLTKEGWDPSMTIPQMLHLLRELILHPDITALGDLWRQGSGILAEQGREG